MAGRLPVRARGRRPRLARHGCGLPDPLRRRRRRAAPALLLAQRLGSLLRRAQPHLARPPLPPVAVRGAVRRFLRRADDPAARLGGQAPRRAARIPRRDHAALRPQAPAAAGDPAADDATRPAARRLMPVAIVGYGAGGHARSLLEALRSGERFEVVALADDDPERAGATMLGVPIVAAGELERLREQGVAHAFVGVGGGSTAEPRRRGFARLAAAGFDLPPVVHAAAAVSPWAELGRGAQVLALTVVNAAAVVADGAIVNTG